MILPDFGLLTLMHCTGAASPLPNLLNWRNSSDFVFNQFQNAFISVSSFDTEIIF